MKVSIDVKYYLLAIAAAGFLFIGGGCSTHQLISIPIPEEMVQKVKVGKPIFETEFNIEYLDNPEMRHYYDLEESIEDAMEVALTYSNIFGAYSGKAYHVTVTVKDWDIPTSDTGRYQSRLSTRYVLYDEDKTVLFEKDIITEAKSNVDYFADYRRARRSATLNVAKNVNSFVTQLVEDLQAKQSFVEIVDSKSVPETDSPTSDQTSLADQLQKLSELHTAGALTDEEFKKAKEKLLNSGSF